MTLPLFTTRRDVDRRTDTIARNCFAFYRMMTPRAERLAGQLMLDMHNPFRLRMPLPPTTAKEARLIRDK
jgi:hypothetical protein